MCPQHQLCSNTRLQKGTFHAVRDIAASEELTLTYNCNVNCTKRTRQGELRSKWGFVCTCPACEDIDRGKEHEERRALMFDMDERATQHIWFEKWKDAVEALQELAVLQVSEGVLTLELAKSYHDIAKACMKLPVPDLSKAAEHIEKKLDIDRYCKGEDDPDYQKGLQVLRKLESAADNPKLIDTSVEAWFDL